MSCSQEALLLPRSKKRLGLAHGVPSTGNMAPTQEDAAAVHCCCKRPSWFMAKASSLRGFSTDQHVPGGRLKDKLQSWVSSTTCSLPHGKKKALGHTGLQSISHSERTKECAIRTVHRKHMGKLHRSLSRVFPQKHAPRQQLLCQPVFLPSAKYKPAGSQQLGKQRPADITTPSNQSHTSPQGFREWMELAQAQTWTPQFIPFGWLQSKEGKGQCHSWTSCSAAQRPASPGPSQYQYFS